ncbi:hypothetical protein LSAT2_025041 [Lamellibrachia satsuma]|nr:hypothetical protein LSAT2_025041 [Lamellibrachia satsuma]
MATGRIVVTLILIAQCAAWTVARKICVEHCFGRTNGYYQSCTGCGVFVACSKGKLNTMECVTDRVWDDYSKACVSRSKTCPEAVDASAAVTGLQPAMPGGFDSQHAEGAMPRWVSAAIAAISLLPLLVGGGSESTSPPAAKPYPGPIWSAYPQAPPNYNYYRHPPTYPHAAQSHPRPTWPRYPPAGPPNPRPPRPTYPPTAPPYPIPHRPRYPPAASPNPRPTRPRYPPAASPNPRPTRPRYPPAAASNPRPARPWYPQTAPDYQRSGTQIFRFR